MSDRRDMPRMNARGLARHEMIIKTATELFLARGFDAVSLDEVIRATGGSKTNVYKQFGGKEGLFAEIVRRLAADFLSPLTALDLRTASRETGLAILGRTLMQQLMQPRHIAFQRMIMGVSDKFPELMAEWYRVGPQKSQSVIAAFLGDEPDGKRLAIFFHDMIVTDAINHALMGDAPAWSEVEARISAASALLARPSG